MKFVIVLNGLSISFISTFVSPPEFKASAFARLVFICKKLLSPSFCLAILPPLTVVGERGERLASIANFMRFCQISRAFLAIFTPMLNSDMVCIVQISQPTLSALCSRTSLRCLSGLKIRVFIFYSCFAV